jgi:hypothetical protein
VRACNATGVQNAFRLLFEEVFKHIFEVVGFFLTVHDFFVDQVVMFRGFFMQAHELRRSERAIAIDI